MTIHKKPKKVIIISMIILVILLIFFMRFQERKKIINEAEAEERERLAQLANENIPQENAIHIPALDVIVDISEGEYEGDRSYLKTWRRTHTNTPDRGGNTVIVGHRYQNKQEYPLFKIDEIAEGDIVTVYWEGIQYDYKVTSTFIVGLYDISVEDPTDEDILTLYACDWSGKNRLIVRAELQ